jgi:hypothetical protein
MCTLMRYSPAAREAGTVAVYERVFKTWPVPQTPLLLHEGTMSTTQSYGRFHLREVAGDETYSIQNEQDGDAIK